MEDLPANIIFEILTSLPVKSIIHCKLVCKKWLHFITDSFFANLHLTKSAAGLMVLHYSHTDHVFAPIPKPAILRWVEYQLHHHSLHHDPIMNLDLDVAPVFKNSQTYGLGSIHGLICLLHFSFRKQDKISICNPMTREYMILPIQQCYANGKNPVTASYGFGISSITREYKIIWIYKPNESPLLEAEVYTLGTGQWRNCGRVAYYTHGTTGPFLNNHVHWPVSQDEDSLVRIYTFDFDNETFQLFPSPPIDAQESISCYENLGILKGCLCHSYCSNFFDEMSIWVMKEYGNKSSWKKEVLIRKGISPNNLWWSYENPVFPVKILKNGSILMVYHLKKLVVYCPETDTIEETEFCDYFVDAMTYRPSFLKLHNFGSERVHDFQR